MCRPVSDSESQSLISLFLGALNEEVRVCISVGGSQRYPTVAPFLWRRIPAASQVTIKDPAEYNAYTNAIGQSDPKIKASAIESFLTQYPQSVVKSDMLEQLMAAYQRPAI